MVKNASSLSAGKDNDIYLVSLSGVSAAVPVLNGLIQASTSEGQRADLIGALGRIGSPEAVSFLAGRFAKEDEDGRWETLKAMDYIGGAEAKALLEQGMKDKNEACRRLATRILGGGGKN
jgi:HEAT repeat protein